MYISKTSDVVDLIESKPYREIIGSLIYIMVATRPDICYTINRLFQYLSKPNSFHLTRAKHVLRYLKGTINQSLIFNKSQKNVAGVITNPMTGIKLNTFRKIIVGNGFLTYKE